MIVRNLPFDITEQDLRAIFLPYGPIYSVHIPLATETKKEEQDEVKQEEGTSKPRPRSKGFAFVWYLSRKDAEKAMEKCNGMTVEAGVAEMLISDKQKKKKQRREERKRKAAAGEAVDESEGEEAEDEKESHRKRVIAVDWALSKDKWEAEKAKLEALQDSDEEKEDGSDESEASDSDGESDASESGSEDDHIGVHDGDSDESDSDESHDESGDEESDEDEEEQKPAKPTLPPPEVGTTLFIRNVPFEATEDELRTL